jgi:hypothetical protein
MKRRNKINEARIQRAINGLLIPMAQIVPLYALLEQQVAEGADDAWLAKVAHDFIYGEINK